MRNIHAENISEHSHQTAIVAHTLALIERFVFGRTDVNPEKAAVYALYHEASEVITGDMPTPVKYFDAQITAAYKKVEKEAENTLIDMLPAALKAPLSDCIRPPASYEKTLVKHADALCALIKCTEELSSGNTEFSDAYQSVKSSLAASACPSVDYFIQNFIDAYALSLDKLLEK
jgi:5'-deoxynucleotidase